MIVLSFNIASIAHGSFVSISSKLCHTHSMLINVPELLERMSLFFTLTQSEHSSFSTCCPPPTFTYLSMENAQPFPIPFADTSENSK